MRRRQMMKLQTLPAEYRKGSYLESTQYPGYVDTKYYPNQDTRLCMQMMRTRETSLAAVYGTEKPRFTLIKNRADYGQDVGKNISVIPFQELLRVDHNKNQIRIGEKAYTIGEYASFKCTKPLYFYNLNGYFQSQTQFLGRIYFCKIYEKDILVRNFVPCIRKKDNAAGFYDSVMKAFYPGTGTFSYGE